MTDSPSQPEPLEVLRCYYALSKRDRLAFDAIVAVENAGIGVDHEKVVALARRSLILGDDLVNSPNQATRHSLTTFVRDKDRDHVGELRAYLMTYWGSVPVSRWDAENLIEFLEKAGWRKP